jgi:hypothetical protein
MGQLPMSAERLCKGPLLKLTRSRPTWRSWRKAWFVQYHRLAYRHLRSELHQRRIPDRRLSSDHGARQPHLDGELCTCIRCPQIGAWRGGEAGSAPIWTQVEIKISPTVVGALFDTCLDRIQSPSSAGRRRREIRSCNGSFTLYPGGTARSTVECIPTVPITARRKVSLP